MTAKSVPQKMLKGILYSARRKSKKERRARRKSTGKKRQPIKATDD